MRCDRHETHISARREHERVEIDERQSHICWEREMRVKMGKRHSCFCWEGGRARGSKRAGEISLTGLFIVGERPGN